MQNNIADRMWYVIYLTPIVSIISLVYIWNATNPGTIGPFGILCVFVLLYLLFASIFFILIHLGFAFLKKAKVFSILFSKHDNKPFNWRLSYYIASIIAFMPVLLLAMQSVNQLTIRDIILVIAFEVLAIFYVVKRM